MGKKVEKESRIWAVFRWGLAILQLTASVFLMFSIIKMNVFLDWQNTAVGIILAILALIDIWLMGRKKKWARGIGVIFVAMVSGVCIFASVYLAQTIAFLENITGISLETEAKPVDVKQEPFLLYLSGSDSREGLTEKTRSDVNIVIAINPETHKMLMVSIPRDAYVQLHGTTGPKDKLTHAGTYGIDMSRQTIEDLLGVEINYTAKTTFETVEKLVDIVGGIDINSDANFMAYTDKDCVFSKGVQHVDGKCALAFSRERKSYSRGDRHRGENQEQVIELLFEKMLEPENLKNYTGILSAIEGTFATNLSYDEITNFAKQQLAEMAEWEVESYNLDGTGAYAETYSMGSQPLYVMELDEKTIETAKEKITEIIK